MAKQPEHARLSPASLDGRCEEITVASTVLLWVRLGVGGALDVTAYPDRVYLYCAGTGSGYLYRVRSPVVVRGHQTGTGTGTGPGTGDHRDRTGTGRPVPVC